MRQRVVIEKLAEAFDADVSLPDVYMAVGFSAKADGRVVAVTGMDPLRRNDRRQEVERLPHALLSADVVARGVGVRRVEANSQPLGMLRESREDLREIFEFRADIGAPAR